MFSQYGKRYISDTAQNTSPDLDLLCCRACLATDGRMFNIYEYKLADDFSRITETPAIKDHLPQHLCSYCRALLLKCASFRDMCTRTQQRLMTELLGGQLNTDCIRKINQSAHQVLNLTMKVFDTIDYNMTDQNLNVSNTAPTHDLKVVERLAPGQIVVTVEHIKDEPNVDVVDINSIIKTTDEKMKFENKTDEIEVCDAKGRNRRSKIQTRARRKKERKNDKTEIDVNIKTESGSDNDDVVDESVKSKLNYDRCIQNAKKSVKKRKLHKAEEKETKVNKRRTTKNNRTCNKREMKETEEIARNKTFESDYSVQIVILSKEEQLAEIAARKGTRNYLESNFKCQECYKGFDSEAASNNHILRHSPSAGAFVCEICRVRFPKNYMRSYHQDRHRLKILCTKCEFISRTKTQATQHHAVHEGRTYECTHCGRSFQKRSSHLSHVRLAHPERNVACGECGEVFVGENGLKMHKAKMHSEKIKCTTCSAKFVSLAALNRHTDTAGEHADLRPCEQCGENCANETALQEHVRETHTTEPRRCEECNMEFPSSEAYTTHVLRSHLQQRKSEAGRRAGRKPALPGQHMCEQCGRILPVTILSPSLTLTCGRGRRHAGRKPALPGQHMCEQCGRILPVTILSPSLTLTCGRGRRHAGRKPALPGQHMCEQCGRILPVTILSPSLTLTCGRGRRHAGRKPALPGQHMCEQCGRILPVTILSPSLTLTCGRGRRRAGRKPALPGQHMCEQCGRILPSPSILKIHQRTHQGLKPFSCNECSKAFTTKEYLVVHLRSHSGEKPFQCPSCPLAFTQKGNFLRHHKTAHLGVRDSFPCSFCGNISTTKSSLRIHIDSKHGGKGWPKSRKRVNPKAL